MEIFTKIKNSIYGPKYYEQLQTKPLSYSIKYYLVFSLLCALVFAIFITIKFVPTANFLSKELLKVSDRFPQNLEIKIKDGLVSANVNQPYFVKMPNSLKNNSSVKPNMPDRDNIIVIDTASSFDMEKFNSYKAFMLLTKDSIAYTNENGQLTITSLADVKDFTLNRGVVAGFIGKFSPLLYLIYPIVFAGSYIGGFAAVMWHLIYLFFGALLVWAVSSVQGFKIGYKKSYQAGIHLMTFPIIFIGIFIIGRAIIPVPFLFSILLMLMTMLNFQKTAA